jgi:hypothetical protein
MHEQEEDLGVRENYHLTFRQHHLSDTRLPGAETETETQIRIRLKEMYQNNKNDRQRVRGSASRPGEYLLRIENHGKDPRTHGQDVPLSLFFAIINCHAITQNASASPTPRRPTPCGT